MVPEVFAEQRDGVRDRPLVDRLNAAILGQHLEGRAPIEGGTVYPGNDPVRRIRGTDEPVVEPREIAGGDRPLTCGHPAEIVKETLGDRVRQEVARDAPL